MMRDFRALHFRRFGDLCDFQSIQNVYDFLDLHLGPKGASGFLDRPLGIGGGAVAHRIGLGRATDHFHAAAEAAGRAPYKKYNEFRK